MSGPYPIHIAAETESLSWAELVPILEALLPVRFTFSDRSGAQWAGSIMAKGPEWQAPNRRPSVPSLNVPPGEPCAKKREPIHIAVRFADDPNVPFPFRGRSLRTRVEVEAQVLKLSSRETVLASDECGPVWTMLDEGGVRHFRSAFALPAVPAQGSLQDVLNGERFLEILPLLHWLREICAGSAYEGPGLRACFIFDDPNLHWLRYGFVDYRRIATQAARNNYHVAFATIPLDAWFTHERTAELFRRNADRLSLLIHGNDHTRHELARNCSETERVSLLRQAIQRIGRLERHAGVQVCRVMVPPQGACSEATLQELPRCGFEAACISHGSLRAHNPAKPWTRELGYLPSEWIQGCPVLPRWGLSGSTTNTILLAAFLNQPIVLRGHHQDIRNGIERLDELAGFVNSLGTVLWSNLTELSRSSFQWRMEGSTMRLKLLCRSINLQLPEGVNQLILDNPPPPAQASWQLLSSGARRLKVCPGETVSLPERSHCALRLEAPSVTSPPGANGSNRPMAWPIFRRLLTEGRDRFLSPYCNI